MKTITVFTHEKIDVFVARIVDEDPHPVRRICDVQYGGQHQCNCRPTESNAYNLNYFP